jgi:transposase
MRYQFTDDSWTLFEEYLKQVPPANRCGQKPKLSERMFFEALFYLARTGLPWRDLPGEFGCWLAVYQRYRRWLEAGRLDQLFLLLTASPVFDDVHRVMIDSTIVRAHQHSAGAHRKKRRYRRIRQKHVRRLVEVAVV